VAAPIKIKTPERIEYANGLGETAPILFVHEGRQLDAPLVQLALANHRAGLRMGSLSHGHQEGCQQRDDPNDN
jgi:hypothetical protein